ncbi:MAG: CocE/NonD family hydrolase [Bryobacteraceae bacterium]|jgi:putative CocE/NonD family hydrolase
MRKIFSLAFLAFAPLHAEQAPAVIDFLWGVKIPMRDGIRLNATVFKPKAMPAPLPVVFTLTPYIADSYEDRASYFARHGYVFALVDVRGRGNSEGGFEPFANEARDGYDIVEWLARQPWSNGKVAMWGGSYAGFDQWATLKEHPPHLATIVPAAAAAAAVDFPFSNGMFTSYIVQWLTYTSGKTGNPKQFGDSTFWSEKFRERYTRNLPFRELDRMVGNTSTVFQKWMDHPQPDDYWDAMYPTPEQFAQIDIPILTITGYYDGDQTGALHYYRDHMRYGSPAARGRHNLIVGPWDHAGTRTPNRDVGGLKFGEASLLDLNNLHREWYDWTMKDGPKPAFLKQRVAWYAVGPEEWKYAASLEAVANRTRTLYLNSTDGQANDALHSGTLGPEKPAALPAASVPDRYVYDPLDLRPGALETAGNPNYLTDQTEPLNLFGDGLIYHSAPFAEDTEISGAVRLEVWIAMDVPDTDFEVNLYEILPNGGSVLLTGDAMRARYRDSTRKPSPVESGQIVKYEFHGFTWFSRRIAKGSRLRLMLRSPNSIQVEKNYNSGGVVASESAEDARTAHIALYHDARHASFLELPIVSGAPSR